MKFLKNAFLAILFATFITSCEKEIVTLEEHSEIEGREFVYPPTSFPSSYIVNFKAEQLSGKETSNPCGISNGSFETGDFAGWNIETTGRPYRPWDVVSSGSGGEFDSRQKLEVRIIDEESDAADGEFYATNGFDGAGPMTFVMYQDIYVCSCAELTWKDRIWYSHGGEPRTFEVQLRNPDDNSVLETLYTFTTEPGDGGLKKSSKSNDFINDWQEHTVDISSYAGEAVRLYFLEIIPENFTGPAQIDFDAIAINTFDGDNDGVCDSEDEHPYSDMREEIRIGGCYPNVDNIFVNSGSTMMDLINDLEEEINSQYDGENWYQLHRDFTRGIAKITYYWSKYRLITRSERKAISSCAESSNIPYLDEE